MIILLNWRPQRQYHYKLRIIANIDMNPLAKASWFLSLSKLSQPISERHKYCLTMSYTNGSCVISEIKGFAKTYQLIASMRTVILSQVIAADILNLSHFRPLRLWYCKLKVSAIFQNKLMTLLFRLRYIIFNLPSSWVILRENTILFPLKQ